MSRPDRPLRARPLRARPLPGRGGAEALAGGRTEAPVVLSCRQVAVRFGGLQALDRVDLETRKGEIVGLIGPNGAGKTTLMECISGFQPVAGGGITYLRPDTGAEEDLLRRLAGERAGMGIGRTLQNVRLFPYLTVLDNFRVALHRHMRTGALAHALTLPAARHEERSIRADAEDLISLLGMDAFAEVYASELSYGTLRLLELGCMLALKPSMLLLDEPSSGISQKETEALGPLLLRVKQETDATILMIEHDMPLIMGLADWIYCLDAGRNLAAGPPDVVQANPAVIEAYLGTPREQQLVAEATQTQRPRRRSTVRSGAPAAERGAAVDTGSASTPEAETLLELSGIDVYYDRVQVLYDVNVAVRRGERVALLGTNGAGKSTILKTASGLIQPSAGRVRWKGEDATRLRAEELVRRGLGHVPGGRGLFPTLTVGENLRMGGYIYDDVATVDAEVRRAIHYFPWIGERLEQPAGTLSGGEQQQLATARALMARPELLMIDELSLGLAPIVIERLMDTVQRLHDEEGLTVLIVEQQASFA
ncbi:MAG TPA: ATP-binding cassette domain-containing protein, partial [Acidimicrobiales bacterium]|nr:ATP-binding cassette domain-containing protein [Acidimicrobiales bacterium]